LKRLTEVYKEKPEEKEKENENGVGSDEGAGYNVSYWR
jgi:hypothetical protein